MRRLSYLRSFLLLTLLTFTLGATQQGSTVWLYGGGTFAPGDTITLQYSVSDDRARQFALSRILNPEVVLALGGPQAFEASAELELEPLRTVTVRPRTAGRWGRLELGTLPVGMYFAQLGAGEAAGATLILVTDLGLVVKTDSEGALVYTASLASGEPLSAQTFLLSAEGIQAEAQADADGISSFETGDSSVIVAANAGEAWAFSEAYWSRWSVQRLRTYLHTDRPVYRPGHTVFFRGTARAPIGLVPITDEAVEVVVRDSDYNEIFRDTFTTDSFGTFAGELTLSEEPPLGQYTLFATVAGVQSQGSFEVQEFQKPEYRVEVTPESSVAVQGDTLSVTVSAEYLFGGAVTGGRVQYSVLQEPHYRFRYRSFFSFYDDLSYPYNYGGNVIARGEGVLDASGALVLELPLPESISDYRLSIQAGVTDEARREVSATGSLTVYRAGVVLSVEMGRYAYREGEEATVIVRAEDLQGNPVSVPFTLTVERSFYERHRGSRTQVTQRLQGTTDASGIATLNLRFAAGGSYSLIVKAEDAAARPTEASTSAWVTGHTPWYWSYDRLAIEADKPDYAVGDTARFVIQSPIENATLLITLEGQQLNGHEVVRLEGNAYTLELPITAAMYPNGFVGVTIIGDGRILTSTAMFRVPPVEKFLNVELTSDSDTYRPQETGTFLLRVSLPDGTGVRAQVALGLVDEGIYLVRPDRTPDIRGFFHALRPNVVGTQTSRNFRFGQAVPMPSAAPAPPMAPAMEGLARSETSADALAESEFAEAELREDFRDTILWLPAVETDDEGMASITVTFPDNLTEWRLTARAITLGDEVGQEVYSVITNLPVMARLAMPRFFIRGDEATLRVIGQNTLETDQEGRLELSTEGLALLTPGTHSTTLTAGGRVAADFFVQAEVTGEAFVTAQALTPAASDAMRLPVPILAHGVREEIGWAGQGNDGWLFTLPDTTDLRQARGTVLLTPSLAAAVSPALSYLVGFPYGCTEQTMSRFLPSVVAVRAGDLAKLPEEVAGELDEIVAAGLKRLYDFQHSSGGWGFWKYDATNPFISAYVVNGLLLAQEAGYRVNVGVLERGLTYLEGVVQQERLESVRLVAADAKAYAYYALARGGRDISGLAELVAAGEMSPYGLSLSTLAFVQADNETAANRTLDTLLSRIVERERVAYWETGAPRYYWNDDRIEATAYALEALARLRPEEPRVGKVVNWLLLERRGQRWVSTKDTAAVINAALTLAEVTGEASIDYAVTVSLNGETLLERRIQGQVSEGVTIPLETLQAGENEIEISVTGEGTLYSSAQVSFVAERDYLEPQTESFTITRTYQTLVSSYDEAQGVYLYRRQPLTESATGDYVLVTVTLEPHDAYRYVLVNEPLPAGYRVIEEDSTFRIEGVSLRHPYGYRGWNYFYDGRDIRDERIDFYFAHLGHPVTFTYLLRAETPGLFTALPTQAWLMYEPEVQGLGTQARLRVREGMLEARSR